MSKYSTPFRSRLWKKFAIMHSLQVRKTRTHLPTAAQPLAWSQMPPHLRFIGRDRFSQLHGRGCGVKLLMGVVGAVVALAVRPRSLGVLNLRIAENGEVMVDGGLVERHPRKRFHINTANLVGIY